MYCDKNGKYIDADYNIGKFRVKLSNGKTKDLKNTNNDKENVRINVSEPKVIGQDSNNIYRLAKISIETDESGVTIESINGLEVKNDKEGSNAFNVNDDKGSSVSFDVIQVISKSQASGKINGIKYSRNVTSYILCDKHGKKISLTDNGNEFTVVNGKLISYRIDGTTLEAEVVELKSKNSLYYVEKENDDDIELENSEGCIDIDSEGNLWALTDRHVCKFDSDKGFQKVYEVKDDYENISVYDKNNMILWNDEEYAIVGNKLSDDEDDNNAVIVNNKDNNSDSNNNANNTNNKNQANTTNNNITVKPGWAKNVEGQWIYYDDMNGKMHKGWLKDSNGAWYYLDSKTGIMFENKWYQDVDGKWYYLQSGGAMKTGWFQDSNKKWYYFNQSGAMLSNTTVGGWKLGSDGAWIK